MRISDWSSDVCSSDLCWRTAPPGSGRCACRPGAAAVSWWRAPQCRPRAASGWSTHCRYVAHSPARDRSEEHTSEIQSLMRISYAVFCLKKKKTKQDNSCQAIKQYNNKLIQSHKV